MLIATVYKKLPRKMVVADTLLIGSDKNEMLKGLKRSYGEATSVPRIVGACEFYGTEGHVIAISPHPDNCMTWQGLGEQKPFRWTGPEN